MKARMDSPALNAVKAIDFGSGRIETKICYVSHSCDLMEETRSYAV